MAAAFAATLLHRAVDHHIGLFGPTSDDVSAHQGAAALLASGVFAWWLLAAALGASGRRGAAWAALALTGVEALLLNGAVAVLAAPPPSAGFPFQDLAHFAAAGFGAATLFVARDEVRAGLRAGRQGGRVLAVALALALAHLAVSAPLEAANA